MDILKNYVKGMRDVETVGNLYSNIAIKTVKLDVCIPMNLIIEV